MIPLSLYRKFGIFKRSVNQNFFPLKLKFERLACLKYIIIPYIIPGPNSLVSNDFYDSNTILVELILQLADDTTTVTDGSSHSFDVDVEYGSDGSKKSFSAQTIVATHDKTVANFV